MWLHLFDEWLQYSIRLTLLFYIVLIEAHWRIWSLSSYVDGVLNFCWKLFIPNFEWPLHQITATHVWLNWQQYHLGLVLFLFNILVHKRKNEFCYRKTNFVKGNNTLESNYKLLMQMKTAGTTKERHALKYSWTEKEE